MPGNGQDPTPSAFRDIRDYRQPLVTSLGIFLGFLLNFLGQWALKVDESDRSLGYKGKLLAATIMVGVSLLLTVLYRILSAKTSSATEVTYFRILRLYMAAISISFLGVMAALLLAWGR